jgi:osmotically inducible protein OsmC
MLKQGRIVFPVREEAPMLVRTAEALWEGDIKKGKGKVKLGSGYFEGNYSFGSRFEHANGTNPEELIGAAHAGCFSMALAVILGQAGYRVDHIHTAARVTVDKYGDGYKITTIELDTEGKAPGIDEKTFQEKAELAKKNCPVSMALAGVEIKLIARLEKIAA